MFARFPLLSRAIAFLVIPCFILIAFAFKAWLIEPLPKLSEQTISGNLVKDIEISRDENGVVYINAQQDQDVYYAMGYVHAQDRLWQLELQRRLIQGRMSEVFGKSSVDLDVWMRTLGLYNAAEGSMEVLSPEARKSLELYAAGINAWIDETRQLPIEFTILDIKPEHWRAVDSLAWSKYFALDLAGNFREELGHYISAQYLPKAQLDFIFPHFASLANDLPRNHNASIDSLRELDSLQEYLQQQFHIGGKYVGSNAWVVSGKHTKTGQPFLANDPHLGLQIPSLWYAVSQNGKNLSAQGMSLVGLPSIVFGRNQRIAWGGTNMMADAQDLFIEELNPANPQQYRYDQQWKSFDVSLEYIHVKQDFPANLRKALKPVEIEVRRSVHGPIISDAVSGAKLPMALKWTALSSQDTTYESFYRMSYAQDWPAFKQALRHHIAPALNILYADTENNIGYIGVGQVPIRGVGKGHTPVDGSDPKNDWQGFIPFDNMPSEFNPERGYLVSANDDITDDQYPYFISANWALPARSERITQMLEQMISDDKSVTEEDMVRIQKDNKDLSVEPLRSVFASLPAQSEQQAQALAILQSWNGDATPQSIGATIFYGWRRHFKSRLFGDELKHRWNKQYESENLNAVLSAIPNSTIVEAIKSEPRWCDDVKTEQLESCQDTLYLSLQKSLDELNKLAGSNMANWQWGEHHKTLYAHTPFSHFKLLDSIFERRISSGGAENAVNVASAHFDKTKGYVQTFGAGFRQIIQLSEDPTHHWFMNSTGQSGQLFSTHYDDMVEKFNRFELSTFHDVTKLRLLPPVAPEK